MLPKIDPTTTLAWEKLSSHFNAIKDQHLNNWFEKDSQRFENLSMRFNDILFDFSKNRLDKDTMHLLGQLFTECKIFESIEHQFSGQGINETEKRAVLHTALRNSPQNPVEVDGENVMGNVEKVLSQMEVFSNRLIGGELRGFSGKTFTDVVNIGIGGSDLGPKMVYEALRPFQVPTIKCHFVSNIDGAHISETLKDLNPETTLFIIASKTFTTLETMTNANSARDWFLSNGGEENDISAHFVAVSTNAEKVQEFGIDLENMFVFWDWVGGRFSLWSSIGLSICCGLGFDSFRKLLDGAHEMDLHFRNSPFEQNIPLQMAAIGIWYVNFFKAESEAILPYDQNMSLFATYFQQSNMESNGKYVSRNREKVNYETGPIIWGEPGTNGQHAFYQLIHQGTRLIPCDFIGFANSHYNIGDHHEKLLSNYFAQTEALMTGKSEAQVTEDLAKAGLTDSEIEQLAVYKIFEGNRPTNSILASSLDEKTLGALIACYEHKIFAQGVIWNIYSFDQWGVELGKQLAGKILPELGDDHNISGHDSSTNGLINHFKSLRQKQ